VCFCFFVYIQKKKAKSLLNVKQMLNFGKPELAYLLVAIITGGR
jgi:hypothetical protein